MRFEGDARRHLCQSIRTIHRILQTQPKSNRPRKALGGNFLFCELVTHRGHGFGLWHPDRAARRDRLCGATQVARHARGGAGCLCGASRRLPTGARIPTPSSKICKNQHARENFFGNPPIAPGVSLPPEAGDAGPRPAIHEPLPRAAFLRGRAGIAVSFNGMDRQID